MEAAMAMAFKAAIEPETHHSPTSQPRAGSAPSSPSTPPVTMRLLHTSTKKIREFADDAAPPYAVLSHTWGDDEVTLDDLSGAFYSRKDAYHKKIKGACARSIADGLDWIWIDTCCVDRTDATDLARAVRSAFSRYKRSQVCYAYLEDVPFSPKHGDKVEELEDPFVPDSAFRKSRWFTRGWTLMELLVPADVRFYSSSWDLIGSRDTPALAVIIAEMTGIRKTPLDAEVLLPSKSVAEVMSWASGRETRVPEDQAYCLMGLFDVSIPIVYGEGREKAFIRLQQAIFNQTNDHTIFAWGFRRAEGQMERDRETGMSRSIRELKLMEEGRGTEEEGGTSIRAIDIENTGTGGILAKSLSTFVGCRNLLPGRAGSKKRQPLFEWTDEGLRIELPLVILSPDPNNVSENSLYAILNCRIARNFSNLLAIPLRIDTFSKTDCFYERSGDPILLSKKALSYAITKRIHIRINDAPCPPSPLLDDLKGEEYFYFRADAGFSETILGLKSAWKPSSHRWGKRQVLRIDNEPNTRYLDSRAPEWKRIVLRFGCGHIDLTRRKPPPTLPPGFILVLDYGGPVKWRIPYREGERRGPEPRDIRVDATTRCFIVPDEQGAWNSLWQDPWSIQNLEDGATKRPVIGDRMVRVDVRREEKCDKDVLAVNIWAERKKRSQGGTNKSRRKGELSATEETLRAIAPVAILFIYLRMKIDQYGKAAQGKHASSQNVEDFLLPTEGLVFLSLLAIGFIKVAINVWERSMDSYKIERRYIAALAGEYYV